MNKFLFTSDSATKDMLTDKGYRLLQVRCFKEKIIWIFLNQGDKMQFSDNGKIVYSDTMCF